MKIFIKNIIFCFKLLAKSNIKNFMFIICFNIITTILSILELFLNKDIINNIISSIQAQIGFNKLFNLLVVFFAYQITIIVFKVMVDKMSNIQMQSLETHIKTELMNKSADIDISYFDLPDQYDKISISRDNATSLYQIVYSTIETLSCIITIIISIVISIKYSIALVLLTILFMLPTFLIKKYTAKNVYSFDKLQYRDIRKNKYINSLLFSSSAAKEVRFYDIGNKFIKDYQQTTEDLVSSKINNDKKNSIYNSLISIPYIIFSLISKTIIVSQIITGAITIGDYALFTGIIDQLYTNINSLSDYYAIFISYNEKINDFKNYFLLNESEIQEGSKELDEIKKIEFRNITFSYPGTKNVVLSNVSFIIKNKEKIMLVGLNGSGKTTLIKLLTRFYQADSGSILINDISIEKYSIYSVRAKMSVVFQDYNIYDMSLRENVAVSKINHADNNEKIRQVLGEAQFYNKSYIDNKNLDVEVNKRFESDGIILSGGERQKLAIARAFFRDADLMVLDEPTASLDPIAEKNILDCYSKMHGLKIMIMVSHRLLNAIYMDKIILLDKGKVSGLGSHSELYRKNLIYKQLFDIQSNKFNK